MEKLMQRLALRTQLEPHRLDLQKNKSVCRTHSRLLHRWVMALGSTFVIGKSLNSRSGKIQGFHSVGSTTVIPANREQSVAILQSCPTIKKIKLAIFHQQSREVPF